MTTCPYIWVDRDFALARGWIQGFPKKLGSIWITRTSGSTAQADPGLSPGASYGGTCAANERRLAEGRSRSSAVRREGPTHNEPPLVNVRHFPRLERAPRRAGRPRARPGPQPRPLDLGDLGGRGDARAHGAPNEEHAALAPVRMGKGFRFTFAYTVDDLETRAPTL